MDNKIKIGVIGFGRMGAMHGALFNSLEDSKLIAISDPSNFPAKPLGVINPSIEIFKDAELMLEKTSPDAIIISTPVFTHIQLASLCVEKGIPFLLEKPLSINAAEALPLIKALENTKKANMIGYVYRFHYSFARGKEILNSNCLGNIQRVCSYIYISQLFKKGKGWRYDPSLSGGGVLSSLGSHVIDLLTWYFGPVTAVVAKVKSVYSPGIDDFAHLIIEHETGNTSIIDCSWSVRFKRKLDVKIDVLGDNGSLTVSEDSIELYLDNPVDVYPAGKTILNANDLYKPVPVDIGTPKFTFQSLHFLESVKNNRHASPDLFQGYHIQQIVDAGYESSQNNSRPISVDKIYGEVI